MVQTMRCTKQYSTRLLSRNMFYIYSYMYQPNTAATNRLLAMLSSLSKNGVSTSVLFFLPSPKFDVLDKSYPYINVNYSWKSFPVKNRYFHYLLYKYYLYKSRKKLKEGDSVLLLGLSSQTHYFRRRKDIKLFHECTESPLVIPPKNIGKYLSSCRELDGLFVISYQLRDYFVQEGVNICNIEVINMIVDVDRFTEGVNNDKGNNYITYCGNLSNSKDGVDLLLRAFSIVVEKYPLYKLQIIGQQYGHENCMLIKELGIVDKIVYTGSINANEIPKYLLDSRILVLCRPNNIQAQYGFPTKLGEYLLSGNPVVITSVGDIPLYFKNQQNAMVSQPNDIEDFASKIMWLIENPQKAKEIGMNGKATALKCFNADIEVGKMISFISKN